MARPSFGSIAAAQLADCGSRSDGFHADRVAFALTDLGAFRHSIANRQSNRNPGANTNPIVFHDSIAIANRYRIARFDTGADSELTGNRSGSTGRWPQVVP